MPLFTAIAMLALQPAKQDPAQLPDVGQRMKENQEALLRFTHKRRTTVTYKDKSRSRVDQIRYVEGKMEATPVDNGAKGSGSRTRGRRGGRLAQRKIEKKREEMRAEAEQLAELLHRYLPPPEGLFAKAKLQPQPDGLIEVTSKSVVIPKDSILFHWNVKERCPQRLEIRTELDGTPVAIAVSFTRLPEGGPFHTASATLSHPSKHLTVRIENYDFQPDSGLRNH